MKLVTQIPKARFDAFVSQHKKNHFMQSYDWGRFKAMSPDWDFDTIGLEDDAGHLVAAALVLLRRLPVIRRPFIYIPRGFVIDFDDLELVKVFTKEVARYSRSRKALFFKIDPDLRYAKRDVMGQLIHGTAPDDQLLQDLKSLGYKHLGFNQDFDSTIQPRFTFRLSLDQSEKELLKNCHPKTRYNIKVAQKRGVEILEGTREDLAVFAKIMGVTGSRNGFLTRPLSYFEEMFEALGADGACKLYLARLNPAQSLATAQQELADASAAAARCKNQLEADGLDEKKQLKLSNKLEAEVNKAAKLAVTIAELQALAAKYPDGLYMSGIITVYFGNKAWYLYGASDDAHRDFMPNYLIQWQALTDARTAGYEVYDFFGISGRTDEADPLHGLYRFKKGFGGEFTEFIGEFDYVISPFFYFIWTRLLPQFKKYKKILRRKR